MKMLKNASGVYVVRIQTEHGRRTISTGSKNFGDAQKMIRLAKVKELEQTGKVVRLTRDVVAQIVSGRKVRVREALEEWNQWMEDSHKTQRTAANNLMTVLAWAREMKLEDVPVNAITEKEISRWINNPKDEGKASWKNVKLSCVRRFFDFCSIRNYCLGDPSKLVRLNYQTMSHAQKERRKMLVYAEEEIERIVQYVHGRGQDEEGKIKEAEKALTELPMWELKFTAAGLAGQRRKWEGIRDQATAWRQHWQFWEFAVVFGRGTGLRLGDICQLEWDCFKNPGKVIVWTDKRDRRVELPMEDGMKKVFERVKEETSNTQHPTSNAESRKYLFPERREQARDFKKRAGLSVQFSRLSIMAGVRGHQFKELRNTYCIAQKNAGVPMEHIRLAVGHMRVETTMGYVGKG